MRNAKKWKTDMQVCMKCCSGVFSTEKVADRVQRQLLQDQTQPVHIHCLATPGGRC